MPRQIRVRALIIRGGGNVQVGRGMGRNHAVPQIKRIVIKAAYVSVTRPIPPDDIARGQAAQGGHLDGQASRQQAGADKPWCPPGSPYAGGALVVMVSPPPFWCGSLPIQHETKCAQSSPIGLVGTGANADRKSTRLNSSHRCI